jgi:cobaltochelatase CobN
MADDEDLPLRRPRRLERLVLDTLGVQELTDYIGELREEIARVVRGRAANPVWIKGMMRHDYRGAAEIAKAIEGLFSFAAALPERLDGQFELLFDATLGDPSVDAFLRDANPQARAAMAARFREALARDLWRPRRNSVAAELGALT